MIIKFKVMSYVTMYVINKLIFATMNYESAKESTLMKEGEGNPAHDNSLGLACLRLHVIISVLLL